MRVDAECRNSPCRFVVRGVTMTDRTWYCPNCGSRVRGAVDPEFQTEFQKYGSKLRWLGFKRASGRASDCRIYEKQVDKHRKLDLQIWSDGNHRVSHWIDGCMSTTPTGFKSLEDMIPAIEVETRRKDNLRLRRT